MNWVYYFRGAFFRSVKSYRRTFVNWIEMLLYVWMGRYPCHGILRDTGAKVGLPDFATVQLYIRGLRKVIVSPNRDKISFTYFGRAFTFEGFASGDLKAAFGDYRILRTKNRIVLDIGANIGDSSIAFAAMGASKVIGMEPSPYLAELAKKNVLANEFQNVIDIVQGGCSGQDVTIYINPEKMANIESKFDEHYSDTEGVPIRLWSLTSLCDEYNLANATLKMDCEGCEYATILSAPRSTLRRFDEMIIEFHQGEKRLVTKLKECGFLVTIYQEGPFQGKLLARRSV